MAPSEEAEALWEGIAELTGNLSLMVETVDAFRPWNNMTVSDFVKWALASSWIPFDPAKFPYQSSIPLPEIENESVDQPISFDGVLECRDEIRGRFLSASRDLNPGENLIVEKPFASILHVNHGKVVCCLCKKHPLPTEGIICESCGSAAWCSAKCRESSLPLFHAFECAFIRCEDKTWLKNSRLFRLAARMIIKGWKNVVDVFLEEWLNIERRPAKSYQRTEFDLIANEACVLGGVISSSHKNPITNCSTTEAPERRYPARCALWSKTYLYLLKSAGFVGQLKSMLTPFVIEGSCDESSLDSMLDQFLGETLFRHVIRLKCNHFESWHTPIGVSLYLTIAQINHSCRPNCNNFFRGETHHLRASKHIKKGEELFIVYDKAVRNLPQRDRRKKYMASQFGFECLCDSCNEGEDLEALYLKEDKKREKGEGKEEEGEEEEEEERRRRVFKGIDTCKRLMKSHKNEKAEKWIYEMTSLAAAAEMWRCVAELEDLLNEAQSQSDIDKIDNDWME